MRSPGARAPGLGPLTDGCRGYLPQHSEVSQQHEPPEQQPSSQLAGQAVQADEQEQSEQQVSPEQQQVQPSSQPAEQSVHEHEQEQSGQQVDAQAEVALALGLRAPYDPQARVVEARMAAVMDRNFFMGIGSTAAAIGRTQRWV